MTRIVMVMKKSCQILIHGPQIVNLKINNDGNLKTLTINQLMCCVQVVIRGLTYINKNPLHGS